MCRGSVRCWRGSALSLPYVVVDAAGREVEPVRGYPRDLLLGDVSRLTCRAMAMIFFAGSDLLTALCL